jgi:inorganic phosphate transporter, PiT family
MRLLAYFDIPPLPSVTIIALILCSSALLAYANGANANFKGVATLYGSGTCSFSTAMHWSTVATALGAAMAMVSGSQMLAAFSGKGLVPDQLVADPLFLFAASVGAMLTGGMATWLGFPVSTSHALTGGLLGAGLWASAGDVNLSKLWSSFAMPLLLGPFVAVALGALLHGLLKLLRAVPNNRSTLLDALHFFSAGAVCFARGWNDLPKMAALLAGVTWLTGWQGMGLIAICMTLGGILSARAVAETLAHKITDMNAGQGCVANVSTAALVIAGSVLGLPLSTTHVSVGSMLGIGMTTGRARWRTVVPVLLAWVITVPCAALLAALSFAVAKFFLA